MTGENQRVIHTEDFDVFVSDCSNCPYSDKNENGELTCYNLEINYIGHALLDNKPGIPDDCPLEKLGV